MTMRAERRRHIEELFSLAVDLPPDARAAFLRERCGPDSGLRREVEALLDHDEQAAHGFMSGSRPSLAPPPPSPPSPSPSPPLPPSQPFPAPARSAPASPPQIAPAFTAPVVSKLGAYTIVRQIGVGGMGVVYEAIQDNPRRAVALKVIRPGVISRQLLRRFEAESRVLALLKHPGIAQVYEAGEFDSPAGRQPFFAMELIRGEPIDRWCRRRGLDAGARLDLIAKICDAVEHAHGKGVVHRDLKPGNVLVDESGTPRVLDFGVARLQTEDGAVRTLATDAGQLVGTLPYMSPEQIGADPSRVGPHTDVYALGVMLYELLAGRLPLDVGELPLPEAARVIAEVEPIALGRVSPLFAGDVETIAGKAMNKEPSQRYASAAELAAELRRHLRDEPILARPTSALGQLRKFARRNRALVGGVAATIVALAAGLVVSTVLAIKQAQQRDRAELMTKKAEQNELRSRRKAYKASIAAAQALSQSRNAPQLREALSGIPEHERGWEWRHLSFVSDRSIAKLDRAIDGRIPPVAAASGGAFLSAKDQTILRWDGHGPPEVAFARTGAVTRFDVRRDGTRALLAHGDRIRMIDRGGAELWSKAGSFGFTGRAFDHDERRVIVADRVSGRAIFLDGETGEPAGELGGLFPGIQFAGMSETGRYAYTLAREYELYDVASGRKLRSAVLMSPAFSPDDELYLEGPLGSGLGRFVDPRTGALVSELRLGLTIDNHWTIGRDWIVGYDPPGNVALFDRRTLSRGETFMVGSDGIFSALLADHRSLLAVLISTGDAMIFDTWATPQPWVVLSGMDSTSCSALSPDGKTMATGGWGTLSFWDAELGVRRVTLTPTERWIRRLEWSPESAGVAGLCDDGSIVLAGEHGARLAAGVRVRPNSPLRWRNGREIVACSEDSAVVLVTAEGGEARISARVPLAAPATSLAVGPEGRVWVACADGAIAMIAPDGVDATVRSRVQGCEQLQISVSKDGARMAVGDAKGEIRVLNVETDETITAAKLPVGIQSLAWSPDGSRIAAALHDRSIALMDATWGDEVLHLEMPPNSPLRGLVFSPSGASLIGYGGDSTAWAEFETEHPASEEARRVRPLAPAATRLVLEARRLLLVGDELREAIRKDEAATPEVRELALQVVDGEGPLYRWTNSEIWGTVLQSREKPETYRRAVIAAKVICSRFPENPGILNTLGVAQFRAGDFEAAVETLERCERMHAAEGGAAHPLDLAPMAMAMRKLGRTEEAAKKYQRFLELMRLPQHASDSECIRFAAEARAALGD